MSTTNKEDYVSYIQRHYDQEHVVKCQLVTEEILQEEFLFLQKAKRLNSEICCTCNLIITNEGILI